MSETPENHFEINVISRPHRRRAKELVGVSIVSYFSAESVDRLLKTLKDACTQTDVSVIVKDNSGAAEYEQREALQRVVAKYSDDTFRVAVHSNPSNVGYAAGNNMAVRQLMHEQPNLIWILNPDCSISGSTTHFYELFESTGRIWSTPTFQEGALSDGFKRVNSFTGRSFTDGSKRRGVDFCGVTYPGGHSILFTPDAWEKLGGFSEDYFLYMEEADLVTRAQTMGIQYGTLTGLIVNHEGGGTTSVRSGHSAKKSSVTYEEATRSRVTYLRKHRKERLAIFIPLRILYAVYKCLSGESANSRAILRGLQRRDQTASDTTI